MKRTMPIFLLATTACVATAQQRELTLVETARFGSIDGPVTLTRVGDILHAPDGRVYVTQPVDAIIRVFTVDGRLLTTIGGRGSGPGEFNLIDRIAWYRDSLAVHDPAQQCITLLAADGGMRTIGEVPASVTGSRFASLPVALLHDGSALVVPAKRFDTVLNLVPLVRVDASLEQRLDDVATISRNATRYHLRLPGGGRVTSENPAPRGSLWAAHPFGAGTAVLEQPADPGPEPAELRIRRFAEDGRTLFDRTLRHVATPIAPVDRDRLIDDIADQWTRQLRTVGRTQDAEAVHEAVAEVLDLPSYWPAADRLLVGTDGSVWFRRQGPSADRIWEVLGPDGALIGQVRVPPNVELHQVSLETVWASTLAQDDVPVVVRYDVR